jgi:hypothetical protein
VKSTRLDISFAVQEEKHREKQEDLFQKKFIISQRISKINDRVKERCKHVGDTHHRRNMRDDVSYTHRIICDDCGEQIGNYGVQAAYG